MVASSEQDLIQRMQESARTWPEDRQLIEAMHAAVEAGMRWPEIGRALHGVCAADGTYLGPPGSQATTDERG